MKKNILSLLTSSYGGGAERLVLNQMNLFNFKEYNFHVITFRQGQLEKEFRKTKAKYNTLNTKFKFSILTLLKLNNYIKKNKIEIIHAHLIEPEIYSFFLKILNPKLKIIITKHNANDFKKKLLWGLIGKLTSICAEKVITVSGTIKKFSQKYEHISQKKIVVYPNGTNTSKIKRIVNSSKIRKRIGLKKDEFVVGVVGRLTKQKGHIFLIKAAEILKNKIPKLKIIIIGDGKLKDSLEYEVEKRNLSNIIKFVGFRHDIKEIYSAMDIFCMPSLWEGLSIVLLEAMSSESLVVMSNLPNNKEVAEDGKEAVYFNKGNHQELAKKIDYYYKNPKKAEIIRKNAREKVVSNFDFKKNLKEIERLYKNILK